MSDFNEQIVEEFRANAGKVGGVFEGAPLLLLHTTGAKSGEERINPLMYRKDEERMVVFASKGGAPRNPDWYHNLDANPTIKIEVGATTVEAKARVTESDERDRLWTAQKKDYPQFAQYEANTERQIPVIVLEPTTNRPSA